MRSFAVLVLASALLALVVGCSNGISAKDTVDKQAEIEDATKDMMDVDEIPEEERRD